MLDRTINKWFKKTIFLVWILIILFLISIETISATITSTTLYAPGNNTWTNDNTPDFNFSAISDINMTFSCELFIDNIGYGVNNSTANNTAMTITTNASLLQGARNWNINCVDVNGTTSSDIFIITVDTTNPTLTINSPANDTWTNGNTPEINFTITDNLDTALNYVIFVDGSTSATGTANNTATLLNLSTLSDGQHIIIVEATDKANNKANSTTLTINIDTTTPTITAFSPTGKILSSTTEMIVETNEDSTCRYSTAIGVSYENMQEQLTTVDKRTHKKLLSQLSDGVKTYYIRCKDTIGNTATEDYELSFEVDAPPTAEIEIEEDSPLKEGTYQVTVTTSEDVESVPSLKYAFEDSNTKKTILLTGSENTWSGYLRIRSGDNDKTGEFYFSAKDLTGNTGTVITKGNTFMADTEAPPAPELRIKIEQNKVQLYWYYEGEKIIYYRLYKSITVDVDKTNFYKKVNDEETSDISVIQGETYYYAVSAVDEAGNEGSFSNTVSGKIVGEKEEEKEEEVEEVKKISPETEKKIVDSIKRLNSILGEMKTISSKLESKTSEEKEIVQELGLESKVKKNKEQITKLVDELEKLKSESSENKIEEEIKRIEMKADFIKQNTPKEIELQSKTERFQTLSDEELEEVITSLQNEIGVLEMKKYLRKSKKLQKEVSIKLEAKFLKQTYLGGNEEEITLVTKKISSNFEDLNKTFFLEIVPKSIAESSDEITFLSSDWKILKDDPVIKWDFSSIENNQIKYYFKKKLKPEDVYKLRSLLLLNVEAEKESALITGFSVSALSGNINTFGVILGLVIICVLITYYFVSVKSTTNSGSFNAKKKKILKEIKAEVTHSSEAHSMFKTEQKKEKDEKEMFVLYDLINKAQEYIHDENYKLAREMYDYITESYNTTPFKDYNEKKGAYDKIINLYNKMMLYVIMNQAKHHARNENIEELKKALEELNRRYASVTSFNDTGLIKNAKELYEHYTETINSLKEH